MVRLLVVSVLSLLMSAPALALTVTGIPIPSKTDTQRSCYELSAEVTELAREQPGTAGFWSRTEHQVAGVFTLITPVPALAYLGYGAYRDFSQDQSAGSARARIVELRGIMARKQCFVR